MSTRTFFAGQSTEELETAVAQLRATPHKTEWVTRRLAVIEAELRLRTTETEAGAA
jgi:hypothetical protein